MKLIVLAYICGVLTILSPCILPVLPFVFARSDRPFVKSGLPLLGGMALTFALVATLAAVGGGWAVHANQYGRIAAMAVLVIFGLMLLSPTLAEKFTQPFVALGNRLSRDSGANGGVGSSLLLGVATGFLWAPCAGPILGLVLTGAAIQGASVTTTALLLAYAAGAATSLAAALLIGGRLFAAMKKSLGAGEWIKRGLGAAILLGVVAIAFGLDTGLLTQLSLSNTAKIEQSLIDKIRPKIAQQTYRIEGSDLTVEGVMPSLDGAIAWLNSPPLTPQGLRGKVVLVDFWTYSCINCLRALPYVRAWADKYKDHGLVVIGVHAPEFAFEKDVANVKSAVRDLGVTYPVAVDSNLAIWKAFNNEYWPAHYFIDAEGRIRVHHFGEGEYDKSEKILQQLLKEAGYRDVPGGIANPNGSGAQLAADRSEIYSPETYIGYSRAKNFDTASVGRDMTSLYTSSASPQLNHWGLDGEWTVGPQMAVLDRAPGTIVFRFHARDLHLVLGTVSNKPVHFKVTVDGAEPGASHGVDTDAQGNGTVTAHRLYQLVRQNGQVADKTFEIEFLDPGVQAFSFTFG